MRKVAFASLFGDAPAFANADSFGARQTSWCRCSGLSVDWVDGGSQYADDHLVGLRVRQREVAQA